MKIFQVILLCITLLLAKPDQIIDASTVKYKSNGSSPKLAQIKTATCPYEQISAAYFIVGTCPQAFENVCQCIQSGLMGRFSNTSWECLITPKDTNYFLNNVEYLDCEISVVRWDDGA